MRNAPYRECILVTGATGFTGGHLALTLRDRGHRVRALVRPGSDTSALRDAGVELVTGDITNARDVDRAVDGADRVFHIAAVFRTAGHPDSYYRNVNVGGTRHILDAAARRRVARVIHCSTVGVHGAISHVPSDENAPFNPGDIYQETKLEAELLAQEAFRSGLPGVIVRPAGIYGPGDLRFLKLFRSIQRRQFRMFGSGEVTYHLTYIDDLIRGFLLCGSAPQALGDVFIIGGDEYPSLNELVHMIARTVGVQPPKRHLPLWPLIAAAYVCEHLCRPLRIDPPLHMRRVEFFVKPRAFTSAKAKRVLGFEPAVRLLDGLARTAEWYAAHDLLQPLPPHAPEPATAFPA